MLPANCKKKTTHRVNIAEIELLQCIIHLNRDIEAINENHSPE